jgi:hypothetical protein
METVVHTYATEQGYEDKANEMARDGWSVISMAESRPRAGWRRYALLGLLAVAFPPKPFYVVTYTRSSQRQRGKVTQ